MNAALDMRLMLGEEVHWITTSKRNRNCEKIWAL